MKKIFLLLLSIVLIQYFIYIANISYKKSFFYEREGFGYYLTYEINSIYLTTNAYAYPDHTKINLHKKEFKLISKFARNYIIIDDEIKKGFAEDIDLKSPMDYYMISNIDFDENIEILFYNRNHPNIILEITPKGYVVVEKNIFTKILLNIIAWGGPLREQIFESLRLEIRQL